MANTLLKHEKQTKVRNYLLRVSNKRVWDITDFSVNSIKKSTSLKEKEIQNIVLDLQNEKVLLYRHFNFDAYIPNTSQAKEKLRHLADETSYHNIVTSVFLSTFSVIIAILLVQSYWKDLIINLIDQDKNAISIFVKGSITGVIALFFVIVILKTIFDFYLRKIGYIKKRYIIVFIIILIIILSILYLRSNIQLNLIAVYIAVIALILEIYNIFKDKINSFLIRKIK